MTNIKMSPAPYIKYRNAVKSILLKSIPVVIIIFFIWIISLLSKNYEFILTIEGNLSKWIPVTVGIASLIWRFYEIIIKFVYSKKKYLSYLQSVEIKIGTSKATYICIFVSVSIFHFAVLGNLVGIQPSGGALDTISGVGGVLPFADAKQYYAASMSLPISGEITPYASRRPVHLITLSILNILTRFDYLSVFLMQATLVGVCFSITCMAIARWLGPSAAGLIWSMIILLSLDNTPSFMSEPTGLWLGSIAIYILISSIGRRSVFMIPASIAIFIFAFSARAGAIFIIPALILIGAYKTFLDKKPLKTYFTALLILASISAIFPLFVYSMFTSKGVSYQANLSYLLYEMAVDGKDWRQIQKDFPNQFKMLKHHEQADFIYRKTLEAFKKSPYIFFSSYFKRFKEPLINFPINHINEILLNFFEPIDLDNKDYQKISYLFSLIFYVGLIALLFNKNFTKYQKIALFLIYLGYAASLPFIWVSGAMRFHAVTWIFSVGIFSTYLARKGVTGMPPVNSGAVSIVFALSVIAFFYISAGMVSVSASLNNWDELKRPEQKIDRKNGFTHYLLLGPNTPFLKLTQSESPTIRPLIHMKDFYQTARTTIPDKQKIFGVLNRDDSIFVGFDPRTNRHLIFVSDHIACLPKENTLFITSSIWITRPFSMRIKEIQRVAF